MKKKIITFKKDKFKVFKNIFKKQYTGLLILEDGSEFFGYGFGYQGSKIGELCFNTSMTGYQETLTDPSYESQIIVFTFPHIGNVGTNNLDNESKKVFSFGLISREDISISSNWRSMKELNDWLIEKKIPAISGIDTRYLTKTIRDCKAPKALICHKSNGKFNKEMYLNKIARWSGINNTDLTDKVSTSRMYQYNMGLWNIKKNSFPSTSKFNFHIIAFDFGIKLNILRHFNENKCMVTTVPFNTNYKDVIKLKPDGIFFSNGPGDPKATYLKIKKNLNKLINLDIPIFGICLGHQLLSIALGAKTQKMSTGHRGSNHPVLNLEKNKVEITSQNHGFVVIKKNLPKNLIVTHRSLFDGSIEGIKHKKKNIFSVQFHPEASPGPRDSSYLFKDFINNLKTK